MANAKHKSKDKNETLTALPNLYQVSLSPRFIVFAILTTCLACFGLGCLARQPLLLAQQQQALAEQGTTDGALSSPQETHQGLPPLFLAPHKSRPSTRYTSKHYDTGLSAGSDTLLSKKKSLPLVAPEADPANKSAVNATLTGEGEEEIHEPAGQHLLIDVEHVNGAFLNSENHLAVAMIDLVDKSGLTMLSYHCHKLAPAGVSCAGVLLESHVSFHTWPVQGVISLDLFTCGPNSLLNLLGDVKSLFALPDPALNNTENQEPNMVWAFKRRGFATDEGYTPGISDLGTTMLGVLQFPRKEQLAFFQTPFQQVHMYDVLDPRYSTTTLDRRMYLDGVLQARQRGQAAYAEALVHPALLTHSHPKKVAIVGAGDGAALREVLKHSSIESVEWMEIDQDVADISQEWLWSKCDDFLEDVSSCRDDPRVNLYYEDGFSWFQTRYGNSSKEEQRQDVIIMDVLNPEDEVDFSEFLFDDLHFAQILHDALSDDGILAVPLGPGHSAQDPPEYLTRSHHVAALVANLEQVGFPTIHEYEDSHGGILESSSSNFLVAFKRGVPDHEWFASEAQVQVKLHERMERTKSGKTSLSYFDGAMMQSYQAPSRTAEVMFCRNQEAKSTAVTSCRHGIDPALPNVPISALAVSDQGAAVAMHDIPQGSLVGMETCVHKLQISDASKKLLQEVTGKAQYESSEVGSPENSAKQDLDAYNPVGDRNALTRECIDQSMVEKNVGTGEMIRRPPFVEQKGPTRGQSLLEPPRKNSTLKTAASLSIPSSGGVLPPEGLGDEKYTIQQLQDKHQPNYTTAAANDECVDTLLSETGQCLATFRSIADSVTG